MKMAFEYVLCISICNKFVEAGCDVGAYIVLLASVYCICTAETTTISSMKS